MASLSQSRTAAAQCGLFTYKSVPVIFEPPCMCDVPRVVVFCSESIECFPGLASKFFFKTLVTTPVAPIITGIIIHFIFHTNSSI